MAQRILRTVIIFLMLAVTALAAEPEGFKDYKFGMTKVEVEAIAKPHASKYVSSMIDEKIGDITVHPGILL